MTGYAMGGRVQRVIKCGERPGGEALMAIFAHGRTGKIAVLCVGRFLAHVAGYTVIGDAVVIKATDCPAAGIDMAVLAIVINRVCRARTRGHRARGMLGHGSRGMTFHALI